MVSIATWNINSVRCGSIRSRASFEQEQPDVLCLQEIK
jgi:exonuclease III